jgi:Fimbrial assembly protein (PilN)
LDPIRVNLATFVYYDRRVAYTTLVILVVFLAGITLLNLNRGVYYQGEIRSYNDKIKRLEKQLSKRKQTREKLLKELKGEEMQIIREGAKLVNQIIVKDVFPWDRLLDAIETDMPKGMVLKDIKVADDFSKVTLSGFAETPKNIAQLLKNFRKSGIFEKSLLTQLNIEQEKPGVHPNPKQAGLSFEVENSLLLEGLFGGKKYEHFSEDIREAFTIR